MRAQHCPYCNAPPDNPCARKFRYPDNFKQLPRNRDNIAAGLVPALGQLMWNDHHKGRKEKAILANMFIIPESLDYADIA